MSLYEECWAAKPTKQTNQTHYRDSEQLIFTLCYCFRQRDLRTQRQDMGYTATPEYRLNNRNVLSTWLSEKQK